MSLETYPKREPFFSHRFVRVTLKMCLAQEIGSEAVLLLAFIAHTEDAKNYRAPVTFYNGQLIPVLGLNSVQQLDRVRKKCIKAGWLHYEPGTKGVAGKYWVIIPPYARGLDDLASDEPDPTDETFLPLSSRFPPASVVTPVQESGRKAGGNVNTSGTQAVGNVTASNHLSTLSQDPNPTQEGTPPKPATPAEPSGEDETVGKPKPKKPATPKPPAEPRDRDLLFDAIAEVTGSEPATMGSRIGKVKKELLAAKPPYTPEEVLRFCSPEFLSNEVSWWKNSKPTLAQLTEYIGRVRNPSPKSKPRPIAFETPAEKIMRQREEAKAATAERRANGEPEQLENGGIDELFK